MVSVDIKPEKIQSSSKKISIIVLFNFVLFHFVSETRSYYVVQAALELMAVSCLSLSAGVIGMYHHAWSLFSSGFL